MSTLVTRSGKGSPLTHNEVDTNFTNLNTDKVEKTAAAITGGTINNTTIGATTPSTGVFTTLTAQNETLKGTGQNLILRSQALTTTPWVTNQSPTTVSFTDPLGGSTATQFTTSLLNSGVYQFFTVGNAITVTWSLYVKYVSGDANVRIGLEAPPNSTLTLNCLTGVIASTGAGLIASGSINAGNGWYRVFGTCVTTSASAAVVIYSNSTNASSFAAWGTQTEIGSTANTYIPTTTTAVYGTPTLSFSGVASIGLQSDGSLYETSAGTGNVRFYTNNIGQEQARVSHTASAVNYHQLTGSATGSGPIHSVAGSDTNIDLNLTPKGTGQVKATNTTSMIVSSIGSSGFGSFLASSSTGSAYLFGYSGGSEVGRIYFSSANSVGIATSSAATQQFVVSHTASAVNYVQVTGAATGSSPTISSQGSDASPDLTYNAKGAGRHFFQSGGSFTFQINPGAGQINRLRVQSSPTGFGPILDAVGSDTNIPLVLQPKGTGALQAQQTDSTATGGNARGANAVDWQTSRNTAAKVANGQYAVISGGNNNTASGINSFIGGGTDNSATTTYSTVCSGLANTSSGLVAVIAGGQSNVASSYLSFIGSGISNLVGGRDLSAVVGGQANTAGGFFNFVGGGFTNSGTSQNAVTTQSGTMNGTTAVTLSGSNASIKVGQVVTGTSIASYTYVAAISGTSLTLSQAASGSSTSTLSFYTPHGVVVGGGNNQATGAYSFIGGGGDAGTAANRNSVVSDWGVVVGGFKNTIPATGIANTIGGGYGNTISSNTHGSVIAGGGTYNGGSNPNTITNSAAVISGGINNSNSSFVGFIGGGFNNTASGSDYATIVNGQGNTANSSYSFISGGYGGTTRGLIGYHVFPASNAPVSTTQGVQQAALLVLGVQTTDATATVLRSNPSAAGTTNQVILPNNSAYYFKVEIIANVTGGGNTSGWELKGVIKRGANAASTTIVGSVTSTLIAQDAGASTWAVSATADTTNGGLKITCTGQASTTIRWVAKASTTEVTF